MYPWNRDPGPAGASSPATSGRRRPGDLLAAGRRQDRGAAELGAVQVGVETAGGQQVGVGALLDDPAAVDDQDPVGVDDGRQPVGDDQAGPALEDGGQGLLDVDLGLRVEVGGGLLKVHDGRVGQQQPGDGQALLLPARQPVAALPDHRLPALGQALDQVQDPGRTAGGLDLLEGRVRVGVAEVGQDGLVEQVRVLGDQADRPPETLQLQVAHVDPVDPDGALADVVDPGHQHGRGRLAGPGRADQGDQLAGPDAEADVVQDRLAGGRPDRRRPAGEAGDGRLLGRRVAEPDVVELDPPGRVVEGDGPGPVADRALEVEHLEDPLEGHERGHHVHAGVGEGGQGAVDLGDEGGQGDNVAGPQLALEDQPGPEPVDGGRADGPDQAEDHEEGLAVEGRADADVADPGGLVGEAGQLAVAAPEQHHQQRPGDVEALVHGGVHGRVELHRLAGDDLEPAPDPPGREQEQRQHGHRDQGDAPVQQEHGDQGRDQADDVGEDRPEGAGEGPLGADHVAVEAAGEGAGLGVGEEGQRLALDVVEQAGPQPVDQALADARGQEPLAEGEPGIGQGDPDGGEADQVDQPEAALGDGGVEQLAHQQGRDHRGQRGEAEQEQVAGDLPAEVAGEPPDAPDYLARQLGAGWGRLAAGVPVVAHHPVRPNPSGASRIPARAPASTGRRTRASRAAAAIPAAAIRNDRSVPTRWTRLPPSALPIANPVEKAVVTQVKASVTVPAGASRSTSRYRQAMAGAMPSPARTMPAPSWVRPLATASRAIPATTRASSGTMRCSGPRSLARLPKTRPPTRLPRAHRASRGPAKVREPSCSAPATTVTSTVPKALASSTMEASTARMPGLRRGPAQSAARRSGRQARDAGVEANTATPASSSAAVPSTAAAGEKTAASTATSGGPTTKISSCTVDSTANAAWSWPPWPSRPDQSARMHAPTGGIAAPARAASPARTSGEAELLAAARAAKASALATEQPARTRVWPARSTSRPSSGEVSARAIE